MNSNTSNLTTNEYTAFMAGRADAHATRWRVDAEMSEREGQSGLQAREYAAEYEAERDRLLAILAERKEKV